MGHLGDTFGHLLGYLRSFTLVPRADLTNDFSGFGLTEEQVERVIEAARGWIVKIEGGNLDLFETYRGEADRFFASMLDTKLVDL